MSELTFDELQALDKGDPTVRLAVAEIRRWRAARDAGRAYIERVVTEEHLKIYPGHKPDFVATIASRVADRLCGPVLSDRQVELLRWMRREEQRMVDRRHEAGVDRVDRRAMDTIALLEWIERCVTGAVKP
jgi:hypothetical protein